VPDQAEDGLGRSAGRLDFPLDVIWICNTRVNYFRGKLYRKHWISHERAEKKFRHIAVIALRE